MLRPARTLADRGTRVVPLISAPQSTAMECSNTNTLMTLAIADTVMSTTQKVHNNTSPVVEQDNNQSASRSTPQGKNIVMMERKVPQTQYSPHSTRGPTTGTTCVPSLGKSNHTRATLGDARAHAQTYVETTHKGTGVKGPRIPKDVLPPDPLPEPMEENPYNKNFDIDAGAYMPKDAFLEAIEHFPSSLGGKACGSTKSQT